MNKYLLFGIGLVIVLIVAGVGFFVVRKSARPIKSQIFNQLIASDCPNRPLFTVPPIDPKDFLTIIPLGNLSPPDHIIPTDHIYLTVKDNNKIDPTKAVPVMAPGDITITRISHNTALKSGKVFSDDYAIDFSPCKDVRANFGHVTKLSDELKAVFDKASPGCQSHNPRPEDKYSYCNADVSYKLSAGAAIGEAGGGTSTGLDWRLVDRRSMPLVWANPKRYRDDQFHFACPIDLYDPKIKAELYERFGGYGGQKRTVEPRCGEVNQDKPGTAQGNWISGDGLIDQPEQWSKTLALVHDNADPTIGVVSIGGVIGEPTKIQFTPKHEGTLNREFGEVLPDGKIYCYQGEMRRAQDQSQPANLAFNRIESLQRVIIQLISANSMKIELQNGSCSDEVSFLKPTVYQR